MQHLLLSNTNQTAIGVTNRPGPTLDLNFAATKNCIDQVSGRDLITFNRSTTGTYFDSAGILRSAAVNLLLRSEEFDNAGAWGVLNATVTANTQPAPNGTTSAETLTDVNGVTSANVGCFQSVTLADSTTYAMSCYVKAGTKTTCRVGIRDKAGTNILANFNLSTVSTTVGNALSSTIQDAGNGWYRCTAICGSVTGATAQRGIVFMDTGSYTANGTGTIHVWGAQLETGSVATDYIPTSATVNSAPRFDHNPTTLESLGLLVEDTRTNSIRNNTMVGAVAGTPGTAPTNWTGNVTQAGITREIVGIGIENGINYIDYRIAGTTTGALFFGVSPEISTSVAATNGQTWTFSSYARLVAGSLAGFTSINFYIAFNNSVGTAIQFVTGGITPTSAALNTQRFTRTATASNALTAFVQPSLQFEAPTGTAINLTLRIGLPQLEQGAFATSVILTDNTAPLGKTRAADVASITGTNFSSWYNQSQGTIFYDGTVSQGLAAFPWFYNATDGTVNNSIGVYQHTSGIYGALTTAGTPITPDPSVLFGPVSGAAAKHALAVKASDTRAAYNGTLSTAQTSTVMPVVNQLAIGQRVTGNRMTGTIRRIIYYPVRIPNAILQAITI